MTELHNKYRDINNSNSKLNQKLTEINQRLQKLEQTSPKQTTELIVEVMTSTAQKASFMISYFTAFASWTPSYDLRVIEVGKPINLTMKANVFQNTDENWENIHLAVSNGNPTNLETYPIIAPWYLSYYNPTPYLRQNNYNNTTYNPNVRYIQGQIRDQSGEVLIGANVVIEGPNTVGTISDLDGKYYLPVPYGHQTVSVSYNGYETQKRSISGEIMDFELSEGSILDEIVITNHMAGSSSRTKKSNVQSQNISSIPLDIKPQYQPTSFTYEIATPYTINSSPKAIQIDIIEHKIPAQYIYYAVPKMDKSVFLTARLTEWQDYNLLDGDINLYLEGSYLGKSILDTRADSDTINISLGRDKGIVIERKSLKDFNKKSFFGNKRTISRAYEITVRNNRQHAVDLKIQDNIPISTDKEIEVDDVSFSSGIMDESTKIITWKMSIPPKSGDKVSLKYSVKFPSNKRVDVE